MKTVSIIVPIYNKQKWLNRCIDSLLKQTYKNIEIILVDDGSTDDSSEICKEYQKNDKRILFFSKSNGGVSSARNYGLDKCNGDYICFVDPDDYISEDAIEKLKNCIVYNNVDIAYSFSMELDENNLGSFSHCKGTGDTVIINTKEFLQSLDYICARTVCNNALYTKEIVNGVYFDEDIRYAEDTLFFMRCIKKSKKIAYIDIDSLYFYITNSQSVTKQMYSIQNRDIAVAYQRISELFEEDNTVYIMCGALAALKMQEVTRTNCIYSKFDAVESNFWKNNYHKYYGRLSLYLIKKKKIIKLLKVTFTYMFWDVWLKCMKKRQGINN